MTPKPSAKILHQTTNLTATCIDSPLKLKERQAKAKITLMIHKKNRAYLKQVAKKYDTHYQTIIRHIIDEYVKIWEKCI